MHKQLHLTLRPYEGLIIGTEPVDEPRVVRGQQTSTMQKRQMTAEIEKIPPIITVAFFYGLASIIHVTIYEMNGDCFMASAGSQSVAELVEDLGRYQQRLALAA